MGVFINPFTDWGFKHIFGREESKDVLIEFLNDLLQGERVITDVRFLNNEQQSEQFEGRKVIYDIFCETDTGEHLIIEMQNRWQEHFKDRGLYYMSQAVVQQAVTGSKWNFKLAAVYGVFFINFVLDKEETDCFRKDVALVELNTGKVFNNKFRQIYIELPQFKKEESECQTFFEYWIYILKHMDNLEKIPFLDEKAIFKRLSEIASRPNLTKEERAQYEAEWRMYNDYFNSIESAEKKARMEQEEARAKGLAEGLAEGHAEGRAEGRAEGLAEAKLEDAQKMKSKGYPIADIAEITGLSIEEINNL